MSKEPAGRETAKVRIAVDAMGGDLAPASVVEGSIWAHRENHGNFEMVLVGQEGSIQSELNRLKAGQAPLVVHHASQQIDMGDEAVVSLKKKDSSIAVGMKLQKEGKADAFISGGNTGAVMTHHGASLTALGRYDEAEEELTEAHGILTAAFDDDHDYVRKVMERLVELYEATGKAAERDLWAAKLEQ